MKCNREGCPDPGTCKIIIRVPPVGYGFESSATITPSLILCRKHAEEETPETWLGEDSRTVLDGLTRGRAPPDYGRARVEIEGIN